VVCYVPVQGGKRGEADEPGASRSLPLDPDEWAAYEAAIQAWFTVIQGVLDDFKPFRYYRVASVEGGSEGDLSDYDDGRIDFTNQEFFETWRLFWGLASLEAKNEDPDPGIGTDVWVYDPCTGVGSLHWTIVLSWFQGLSTFDFTDYTTGVVKNAQINLNGDSSEGNSPTAEIQMIGYAYEGK